MRFLSITKPGIIFGNIVTVSGGYFLGAHGHFHFWTWLLVMLGMSGVIAAGCVFNNYIDRDIDQLMERTKNRVLVQGLISPKIAILYAICLAIAGFVILYMASNFLTVAIAFLGLFVYGIVYSIFWKRKSPMGTLIGGVAGAVPPVVGYCAVTNRFDLGALLLFLILFLWQMPHFYAICIYRLQDFAAAKLPVLPLRKTLRYTKISMMIYIVAFTIVAVLPSVFGYAGKIYFAIALALGMIWFGLGIFGIKTMTDRLWARRMFLFSIINITVVCIAMW